MNVVAHELITVTNEACINGESVCELLRKISGLGLLLPITLVLDNARYQKCIIVRELAAELNIELLYLLAYSPNLNLIERLWKFVKKQYLYSIHYGQSGLWCCTSSQRHPPSNEEWLRLKIVIQYGLSLNLALTLS
jgi:transposase